MIKEKVGIYSNQIRGVSYKKSDLHDSLNEMSMMLLRANNINENEINFDNVVYVDKSKVSDKQYLRKGDIVVCASSGSKNLVGKAAQVDFDIEATFGAFLKVVRPKNIVKRYMGNYFYSNEYRRKISSISEGANINNIRNEHIDDLLISIVDENTQKERSLILDKVSEVIKNKKKQLQEYDQLIKSRFVEMFKNISKCNLSKVAEITMGQSPKSSTYNNQGVGLPFYQGKTEFTDKYIKTRIYCSEPKKLAEPEDVLMSVRAPVGSVNITLSKACIGRGLAAIRGKKGLASNEFLFYALKAIEEEIASQGQGSTFKAINKKHLYDLQVPEANIRLQNEFIQLSKHIDKLKFAVKKSLDETQTLFDSLMQEYFG